MKNSILENVAVEKLVFSGKALAHAPDGRAIMIAGGAIPGSVVNLRVLKAKKQLIEAQIVDVVKPSPMEIELPPHIQVYGGAKWLPIRYEDQLSIKEGQVRECFRPLESHFSDGRAPTFHPIAASPEIYGYRNKLEFSYGKYISGKEGIHDEFRFGFHKQGEFDRIVDCTYCALASERVNAIFRTVDRLSRESGLPTYDPKRNDGFFRHLVIREGKNTGECMAIFSVNVIDASYDEAGKRAFETVLSELRAAHPEITSLYVLRNTGKADIVAGEAVLVAGSAEISEEILGKRFLLGPKSFFQTNTAGAQRLYDIARSCIRHPGGTLLDLYAGTGTIGIILADRFSTVHSVEIVKEASADAEKNARLNGISGFRAHAEPVEKFLESFVASGETADTLVIDPPRDGMHPSAPANVLAFGAKEIVYVSCNPSTLARDLETILASGKYRLTDVYPVDMFPHTHHIETVVRLEIVA